MKRNTESSPTTMVRDGVGWGGYSLSLGGESTREDVCGCSAHASAATFVSAIEGKHCASSLDGGEEGNAGKQRAQGWQIQKGMLTPFLTLARDLRHRFYSFEPEKMSPQTGGAVARPMRYFASLMCSGWVA